MILTGKVTGDNNELLEFANVWESDSAGNKTGVNTLTGINGTFSMQYQGSGFVTANYVGYNKKTVAVTGSNVNILLQSTTGSFDEVVIETKAPKLAKIQYVGLALLVLAIGSIVYDRIKTSRA